MSAFARVPLSSVAEVIRGVTYEKAAATTAPKPGHIPLLRATNIGTSLTFEDLVYVPESVVSASQLLQRGDIVVATSSGSISVVGKSAPLLHEWRGTFGAFCSVIRPAESAIDAHFLAGFLKTTEYRQVISSLAAGVNINNLKRDHLESLLVPIVSRVQQRAIAEAIESYQSRLDQTVVILERIERNLKRYRASVLKAAVEGRLVPTEAELARAEKRDYEPASVLLKRMLDKRRQRWQKEGRRGKYEEPTPADVKNLPNLPEGWCWATVEQICSHIIDCPHSTPKWSATGKMCIRTTEFHPGRLDLSSVRYVSDSTFDERTQRLKPRGGDVVYSREGGILGIACTIPSGVELCLGQRMMLMRTDVHEISRYLMHWLNSPIMLHRVRKLTGGSAAPHLNVGDVRETVVALPPLGEVERIVAHIDDTMSIVDYSDNSATLIAKRVQRLRQSILKWAFEGKLVAQCANDDPATALLARIKGQPTPSTTSAAAAPRRRTSRKS